MYVELHNLLLCPWPSARLEQLVDVEADVGVDEGGVERLEVGVVDVLEHQAGRLGLRVAHHVQQLDHVGAAVQVLQDLDLPLDLRSQAGVTTAAQRCRTELGVRWQLPLFLFCLCHSAAHAA